MANDYDIAVIGAGVAGLNAAITAARHGARTMIIDMLGAGGQVINVDRIDNFPGPAEGMSGFELGPMLQMQADEAGVEFALDTIEQLIDSQIFRRDVIEGSDPATECVIASAKSARFFQWKNIGRLLDHAEQIARPRIVATNFAKLVRRKKAAKFTGMNLGARF